MIIFDFLQETASTSPLMFPWAEGREDGEISSYYREKGFPVQEGFSIAQKTGVAGYGYGFKLFGRKEKRCD
jgi:hypothetical protein